MSQIYAFSDPHFGHNNIAIARGFSCAEEMDELIVSSWNNLITKKDTVYLFGDITMEKGDYTTLKRLKGIINVILGNHDFPQHVPELLRCVNKVMGCKKHDEFWFTHFPIHPDELHGKVNIHGHVHENDKRYFNVCADVRKAPIALSEIRRIIREEQI